MEPPDANGRLTTDDRPRLLIIIASTRPGRVGLPVGQWVTEQARKHGGFEVDVADLAEIDLPLMDEPNHPRLRQYTREHTKAWSRRVDAADAFVFVMPEYNHGYTAPLKNAIDYLVQEWQYKPVGLVSYGGISGGLRAVQSLKPILSGLKMVPLPEAVPIPWVSSQIDDEGRFDAIEQNDEAARSMFDELGRWVTALRPLRPALAPVG
jgi:NAD(P)H-dependent FMN reductase